MIRKLKSNRIPKMAVVLMIAIFVNMLTLAQKQVRAGEMSVFDSANLTEKIRSYLLQVKEFTVLKQQLESMITMETALGAAGLGGIVTLNNWGNEIGGLISEIGSVCSDLRGLLDFDGAMGIDFTMPDLSLSCNGSIWVKENFIDLPASEDLNSRQKRQVRSVKRERFYTSSKSDAVSIALYNREKLKEEINTHRRLYDDLNATATDRETGLRQVNTANGAILLHISEQLAGITEILAAHLQLDGSQALMNTGLGYGADEPITDEELKQQLNLE